MIKVDYLLGIKINRGLTYSSVVKKINEFLQQKTKGMICTTNPEFIISAREDEKFKAIINNSLLSLPDGFGIILGLYYQDSIKKYEKRNLPFILRFFTYFIVGCKVALKAILKSHLFDTTITGIDLTYKLCELAEQKGYSVMLIGGWPKSPLGKKLTVDYDLAEKTAQRLKILFPNLRIIGATSQYSPLEKDDIQSVKFINTCIEKKGLRTADILFVAYNFGVQEKWLARNINKMNVTLGVGVGGSFDFISGHVKRSSSIWRKLHIEWLYRLLQQPYRIKRTLTAFPIFPLKLFYTTISDKR